MLVPVTAAAATVAVAMRVIVFLIVCHVVVSILMILEAKVNTIACNWVAKC